MLHTCTPVTSNAPYMYMYSSVISMPDATYSLLAAGNVRESDSVTPGNAAVVMEEVITYYLKSRNVKYPDDPSHCELLLPLVSLGFTKGDMYNCFYTLLSKYIPR